MMPPALGCEPADSRPRKCVADCSSGPGRWFCGRHDRLGRAKSTRFRGATRVDAGPGSSRRAATEPPRGRTGACRAGGKPGILVFALVRGGGSRGTRTYNLRIKSPKLSYQGGTLSVITCHSFHMKPYSRAALCRRVPV